MSRGLKRCLDLVSKVKLHGEKAMLSGESICLFRSNLEPMRSSVCRMVACCRFGDRDALFVRSSIQGGVVVYGGLRCAPDMKSPMANTASDRDVIMPLRKEEAMYLEMIQSLRTLLTS